MFVAMASKYGSLKAVEHWSIMIRMVTTALAVATHYLLRICAKLNYPTHRSDEGMQRNK